MLAPRLCSAAAIALLSASALAQEALVPTRITAPVKNRGVYSLATGTWAPVDLATAATSDVLYNNIAPSGYFFGGADSSLGFVDEGRIPSLSSPGVTGTADSYEIDCYQIAYCSGAVNPVEQVTVFFESYAPCSDVDLPGVSAVAGFLVTGLPSGGATGGVNCWILAFDLSGTTMAFSMAGDADETFDGDTNLDSFGWLANYPTNTGAQTMGPLISGNCAGTGGAVSDPPRGFGTDFAGIPGASNATGLGTSDFFWIDDNAGSLMLNANGGCFFFGGCNNQLGAAANPWGGFWLQLFGEPEPPDVCEPPASCPTCDSLPNATGAPALISATGDPNTSLVLTAAPVPNTLGQFFYGPMALPGTGTLGDGLLCVGGMVTRVTPFINAGMMMQPANTATLGLDYTAPYASDLMGMQHFQYWFRSGLSTGTGSNGSNAVTVTF